MKRIYAWNMRHFCVVFRQMYGQSMARGPALLYCHQCSPKRCVLIQGLGCGCWLHHQCWWKPCTILHCSRYISTVEAAMDVDLISSRRSRLFFCISATGEIRPTLLAILRLFLATIRTTKSHHERLGTKSTIWTLPNIISHKVNHHRFNVRTSSHCVHSPAMMLTTPAKNINALLVGMHNPSVLSAEDTMSSRKLMTGNGQTELILAAWSRIKEKN